MENKLKKLEIRKLLQEYNFILTDSEYKMEMISENRDIFLEKANEVKKALSIEDTPKAQPSVEKKEGEVDNKKINPDTVSDQTKKKVRNVYREIAKVTHPDRIKSDKFLDVYIAATKAADEFNLFELYQICAELGVDIELESNDVGLLMALINSKREELKKIDFSFIWLWINATNESEKEELIKIFVKQTS